MFFRTKQSKKANEICLFIAYMFWRIKTKNMLKYNLIWYEIITDHMQRKWELFIDNYDDGETFAKCYCSAFILSILFYVQMVLHDDDDHIWVNHNLFSLSLSYRQSRIRTGLNF